MNLGSYQVNGEKFALKVGIDPDREIYALKFDLNFDSTLLKYEKAVEGNFLKQDGSTTIMQLCEKSSSLAFCPKKEGHKVSFKNTRLSSQQGVSKKGVVAEFIFKVKRGGSAKFSLESIELIDGSSESFTITKDSWYAKRINI